jgi:hypothetical protein
MSRKFLIPLIAAAFLAAPAFAPAAMTGLSDSAQAAVTIKSSRSTGSYRATTVKTGKTNTSIKGPTKSGPAAQKTICVLYQAYHQGDDRYCKQWIKTN